MLDTLTNLPFLSPRRQAALRRFVESGGLREFIAFLLVGGTGAVLSVMLNVMFTKAGVRPSLSMTITLAILIPPVYYMQHRLSFRSGRNHLSAFPRYVSAQLFGYILAAGFAEAFPGPFKTYPISAYVVSAAVVAALNFSILKFWAFRHTPATAS